jgi:Ankyrin repeats (3 copies)
MWNDLKWKTFVDRNVDWKYLDWQAELLACETRNEKFRVLTKSFREEKLDYRSLYEQLHAMELESESSTLATYILPPTASLTRYRLKPSAGITTRASDTILSGTDISTSSMILDSLSSIPSLSNDVKESTTNTFSGLISFSESLEDKYGMTATAKLMTEKMAAFKNAEKKEKPKKEKGEKVEVVDPELAKESKKEKKAQCIKQHVEREREFVELPGIPLSLQVLLFTMLTKTKMWHKLLKNPSNHKRNRVEFLTDWFMGFKQRYSNYILCDSCPYWYDIKEMRNFRSRIYYALENNGWLFDLAEQKKYTELKDALNTGINVNVKNGLRKFKGLLHIAARLRDNELLDMLLPYNPDIDLRDRKVMTPLFYAIENRDIDMARRLLEMGADVNVRDEHNATPFYFAVYCCNLEMLKLLSSYGSDPSVVCMLNRNCLLKAAFMDKHEIVEYLLTFDSIKKMINESDSRGRNPLHASCWGARGGREGKKLLGVEVPDSRRSLELLLDAGADVSYI